MTRRWEVENLRQLSLAATDADWPVSWDYGPLNAERTTYRGHATGPQVLGGEERSPRFLQMADQIMADAHFQAACVQYVRRRVLHQTQDPPQ